MRLDGVPDGAEVFVDSPIFIYHFTGVSKDCREFLLRCEQGKIRAFTSVLVLAEVAHRLMAIEAVARGLITAGDAVKKLRARPAVVRRLHLYQEQVEQIPLMGIEVWDVDLHTFMGSALLRAGHGLLVNDSLVAQAALSAGLPAIASADRDFTRVKQLDSYRPADLR